MVHDFKFFVLGRLVLFKNGASSRKFINFAIRVQGKILERILSIRRRPSCVYLVYAENHHAYTKYKCYFILFSTFWFILRIL
jgi:hypothetical protein